MLRIIIFAILCVFHVKSQEAIGDPCSFYDNGKQIHGTCTPIQKCRYAENKVIEEEVKPETCYIEGLDRVVCCPLADFGYATGRLGGFFEATDDGIRRANGITCRYDGQEPMLCCSDKKTTVESRTAAEPEGCPKINNPVQGVSMEPLSEIAWHKCLDYQQYLHKCVSSEEDPNAYRRHNTCGIPTSDRIISGYEVQPKEFPHMAVLGCRNTDPKDNVDIVWIGGGSLISDKYILTAAHVLFDQTYGAVRFALLGTVHKADLHGGELYNIVKRISHEDYDFVARVHDIALLELDRRVRLSEFIRPACLPVPEINTDYPYMIAGWGETTNKGNTSDKLLAINNAHEHNIQDCITKFDQRGFEWDSSKMWCINGVLKDGHTTDSCRGDSGGPLMLKIQELVCTYFVVGIVSFGSNCGSNDPSVYTKVTGYMDWIVQRVWPDEYNSI